MAGRVIAERAASRAVVIWMAAALGWAALFALTVATGASGIGAALWDGNAHHAVAALLGMAWGPILVAVAAPRTKAAWIGMSVALAAVFGLSTLVLTEAFSPLALVALMPVRWLEVVAARLFRRTRDAVPRQAEAVARR